VFHNFNMYAIGSFIAPLLMRYHKLDIAEAGYYSMVVYGLSGIPGLIFGGLLADLLTRRWPSGRMILAGVMFFLAAPLTYLAIDAGPGNPMGFAIPMALGLAAMYVYYSTTYSTIQDLVEPSLRGTAMATYFCAMYLVPVLNLILTFCMCAAARSVPRDIEKLRTWMRDVAAHTPAATE
jgi:MFS family permease